MEAIEFLIALFIVFTFPVNKKHSESILDEQNQQNFRGDWSIANRDDGGHFRIAGMWIGGNKQFN